jgi:hypothetical protein
MAAKIKPDVKFQRPEQKAPEKKGLRGGGPSMKVPGRGGSRRQKLNPTQADRSAVHHADAMSHVGGPADEYDRD